MTTIVAVIKGETAAIGVDSLSCYGPIQEHGHLFLGESKLVSCGSSFIAVAGTATFKHALVEFLRDKKGLDLESVQGIFAMANQFIHALKHEFHFQPIVDQGSVELAEVDLLIVNPAGAFGVYPNRSVRAYSKYYAFGAGANVARGALFALYDSSLDAASLCRRALEAAAEFDPQTSGPHEVVTVALRAR